MIFPPRPDRSDFQPKLSLTHEGGELDRGCAEGEFKNGRPYRAELWFWDHLSAITIFFSTVGMEDFSLPRLVDLLQRETPLRFKGERRVSAEKVVDPSGHEMWSVSLILMDGEENLAEAGFPFMPYEETLPKGEKDPISPPHTIRSRGLKF